MNLASWAVNPEGVRELSERWRTESATVVPRPPPPPRTPKWVREQQSHKDDTDILPENNKEQKEKLYLVAYKFMRRNTNEFCGW